MEQGNGVAAIAHSAADVRGLWIGQIALDCIFLATGEVLRFLEGTTVQDAVEIGVGEAESNDAVWGEMVRYFQDEFGWKGKEIERHGDG